MVIFIVIYSHITIYIYIYSYITKYSPSPPKIQEFLYMAIYALELFSSAYLNRSRRPVFLFSIKCE